MNNKPSTALTLAARAAQLPPPQPGKVVTIPLELAPYWLKLHNREIVSFDERRFVYKGQLRPMPQEQDHDHE